MIVYIGDWIKTSGKWRQVVDVDGDLFAVLGVNDAERLVWYGTELPNVFDGYISDLDMQAKLEGIA